MSTLTKAKKPARKTTVRHVKKPAPLKEGASRVRLTPPPGRKAAEVADLLPPPSKEFNAAFVASVVACRSSR